MPDGQRAHECRPCPRGVADGLLSTLLHRPCWVFWRITPTPDLDLLRDRLEQGGRVVVLTSGCSFALPALPRDVVTVCPAERVDDIPDILQATQVVCLGAAGYHRRGVVYIADLAGLTAVVWGMASVPRTSTYHEI